MTERVGHHLCWNCRHYSRQRAGPHTWQHHCAHRVLMCPLVGPECRHYEYEPGADHQEAAHGG